MKRKLVFKILLDFKKEERWINEMAAKGWALILWNPYTYLFERTEPGIWTYQTELIPKESHDEYLALIAEAGIETIYDRMGWAIFRKPTADGPFELFSDTESQIKHYQSVRKRFALVLWTGVPLIAIYGLGGFWLNALEPDPVNVAVIVTALIIMSAFLAMVMATGLRIDKTIQTLETERRLAE